MGILNDLFRSYGPAYSGAFRRPAARRAAQGDRGDDQGSHRSPWRDRLSLRAVRFRSCGNRPCPGCQHRNAHQWPPSAPGFFLPVKALSKIFPAQFRDPIDKAGLLDRIPPAV